MVGIHITVVNVFYLKMFFYGIILMYTCFEVNFDEYYSLDPYKLKVGVCLFGVAFHLEF